MAQLKEKEKNVASFSFTAILYGSAHKRLSEYTISYFNSQLFNLTNIPFQHGYGCQYWQYLKGEV